MEIVRTVSWMKQIGRAARHEDRVLGLRPHDGRIAQRPCVSHPSRESAMRPRCGLDFCEPEAVRPHRGFPEISAHARIRSSLARKSRRRLFIRSACGRNLSAGLSHAGECRRPQQSPRRTLPTRPFSGCRHGSPETSRNRAAALRLLRPQRRPAMPHHPANGRRPEPRHGDCRQPNRARTGRPRALLAQRILESRTIAAPPPRSIVRSKP